MFEELCEPKYMTGDPQKPYDSGWCIGVKDHFSLFYTLHTDGKFKWYHDSHTTAFYATEVRAHRAAANYYNIHGQFYPYTGAWSAARDKETEDASKLADVNESQVMVFE